MFRLFEQLPSKREEVDAHIQALAEMTKTHEHRGLFDHLYECLSILDQKSSSLLGFNSIIIAVFAIFMIGDLAHAEWIIVSVGMMAILASSLLLLLVVWVHWSTTKDLADISKHAEKLLDVRRDRTIRYRLAWYFAVLSVLALTTFIIVRFSENLRILAVG